MAPKPRRDASTLILVLATCLWTWLVPQARAATAAGFEVQVEDALAALIPQMRAFQSRCGLTAAAAPAQLPCPCQDSFVRMPGSQWKYLGETPTFLACRQIAHAIGYRYFWAQPVLGRLNRYRCYAGRSLWPF